MKRSTLLQQRIAKLRTVLQEASTSAIWSYFMEDFVKSMDEAAFEGWKKTPAERQLDIIECQQQGKLADAIRNWPKKIEQEITEITVELGRIAKKEAEDDEVDEVGQLLFGEKTGQGYFDS